MIKNGVEYYNIEEYKDNKRKYNPTDLSLVSLGRTSSSLTDTTMCHDMTLVKGEPLDSEGEVENAAAPIGTHNTKRALVQLFNNGDGAQRKLKIRINLDDDENAEFIAPLQPKHNLTNFLRYTAGSKEFARDWFTDIRTIGKQQYGVQPQQGKFHLNTVVYGAKRGVIQVEPNCYGAVVYDKSEGVYRAFVKIYDLWLMDVELDNGYLTDKQRTTGVKGQYLYINPKFDTRVRPKTFAQLRKEAGK